MAKDISETPSLFAGGLDEGGQVEAGTCAESGPGGD